MRKTKRKKESNIGEVSPKKMKKVRVRVVQFQFHSLLLHSEELTARKDREKNFKIQKRKASNNPRTLLQPQTHVVPSSRRKTVPHKPTAAKAHTRSKLSEG